MLIDFIDFPPDTEVTVNVAGPIAQPYWTTLKTDGTGHCQLFWRTQAPGKFTVKARADGLKLDESFTVSRQPGELIDQPRDADVKTVEEPGAHGDPSSAEVKVDDPNADPAFAPAGSPRARRTRKEK